MTCNILKVKLKVAQSCLTLCDPMDCSPWNSPGQNTGVGSFFFLQGIFPNRDQTWVSCIAGRFFTVWATRLDTSREMKNGDSLAVQWLGLNAYTAGGVDSISSRGTKILHGT